MAFGLPSISQNNSIFRAKISAAQAVAALPATTKIYWTNIIRSDPGWINYDPGSGNFYPKPGLYRVCMVALFEWPNASRWMRIGMTKVYGDGTTEAIIGEGKDITVSQQGTLGFDKLFFASGDNGFWMFARHQVAATLNASVTNITIHPVYLPLPDYRFGQTQMDI